MELSIICPTYNEEKHIDTLIDSLMVDDGVEKELFIVDGGSTDKTLERFKEISMKYRGVYLVENPERYVNFGFNKAFPLTKGKYVALVGAHAVYPKDYFSNALKYLNNNECEAVGGPLKQKGTTTFGKAVAYCMSNKFGVGDTEFRIFKSKMYVDSVAFAVYTRKMFDEVGLMDTELIKNQDDEFHYRLNKAGFRILMVPEMQCIYYVRNTISGVFKQYYNYGLYKPLVLRKIGSIISPRHFIPLLFVLYLFSLPFILFSYLYIIPLLLYTALNIFYSMTARINFSQRILCLAIFPMLHISYGLGFIAGLKKV